MGSFETFALSALRFGPKKRGRVPVMSANKFYPRKEERELQELTQKEFERAWREALAVAMQGMLDTLEQMNGMASGLPDDFKQAIGKTGEKIVNNAQQNLAKFSEMTIGTPYYPPTLETSIKTDWEATFQQLCISAETDAKARIARIVSEGKAQGKNKLEVEELVERQLPQETKHRAELISRTETAKLNNAATMATYESAGIEYYVWVASIDDRTRANHAAMNGKICKVGEPDTWYEENPDDPLHPIRHERDNTMYHGDPGTDYQCRCTSVPWDPRIDGQYEVKEAPEPEEPEPSKLEVSREETRKAEARAEKAEGELKETKRQLRENQKIQAQIEQRTMETNEAVLEERNSMERKIQKLLAQNESESEKRRIRNDPLKVLNEDYSIKKNGSLLELSEVLNKIDAAYPKEKQWMQNGPLLISVSVDPNDNGNTTMDGRIRLAPKREELVKEAFVKIGKKQTISKKEMDALCTLWHEITHNRHIGGIVTLTSEQRTYLEAINEFVARKTMGEFFERFKFGKIPHPEMLISRGSCLYDENVLKIQKFIDEEKLDSSIFLEELKKGLFNGDLREQKKNLLNALVKAGAGKHRAEKVILDGFPFFDI